MTSETSRATSTPFITPFARRCTAWLMLAVMGNVAMLSILFILSQRPIELDWGASITALSALAAPAYSPALLFFTVILTILDRRGATEGLDPDDSARADRMVANAVRLALTFVLSFASVVVLAEPTTIVPVLFAGLLSFVAIVRAEQFAPARVLSSDVRFQYAAALKRKSESWVVDAFGTADLGRTIHHAWPIVLLFVAVPFVVPTLVMLTYGVLRWGPSIALTPSFALMSAAAMVAPTMLVLVWLAGADKAESPRSRASIRIFLLVMSGLGIASTASIFLFSGGTRSGWVLLSSPRALRSA